MTMDPAHLIPGDATLIENIVYYLKAKGIFDEFRHECLADVDTKPSCQNLSQRVDGYTSKFLGNETWNPDSNKNELRNKLRRNIDGSGMLAVGADHVVDQVINPKIYNVFLPKITEVVHQFMKEQSELLSKQPDPSMFPDNVSSSDRSTGEISENKDKASISDPIADILSFSYSKSKLTPGTNTHMKSENVQHKLVEKKKDTDKKKEEKIVPATDKSSSEIPCEKKKEVDKKKEEKNVPTTDKSSSEISCENQVAPVVTETKPLFDKEKGKSKKDDTDILQEVKKEKDELKPEEKKCENIKPSGTESNTPVEENKLNTSSSNKPALLSKKESNKIKYKSSSISANKTSSNSSEVKKHKKESSDKSSEKHAKSKSIKSPKESPSPAKSLTPSKSSSKEEKESSKTKSHDSSSSSKASDSSLKKLKSSSKEKDNQKSKHKQTEKADKLKISKSVDKSDLNAQHDSSNSEKGSKSAHYSSSYDSSQGSDQEKSSSSISKKEKQKHFSKHLEKGKTKDSDGDNKASWDKKKIKEEDESPSKALKNEKDSKLKIKDTAVVEAAKISSRSNSFGSTSSVSSSSNASKENLVSNPDEVLESAAKDKKKKQPKEKDSCQNPSKTLPPPPPPPPPSSLTSSELTSSAEMSSMEDTQSSSDSEASSSEEISDESSDSELESKDLINNTLSESMLNSSTDSINAFYDIFLYSSSSSEFEGYGSSSEKKNILNEELKSKSKYESELSISSVHTSDLSSYDDELSDDDSIFFLTDGLKKRLSLKEAQELIEKRAALQQENKMINTEDKADTADTSFCTPQKRSQQRSSSFLSSDDESSPTEPRRSLRRERKLNPRYASSEYTSIFNSKKESFITKQSNTSLKNNSSVSPLKMENKSKKTDSPIENIKVAKKSLLENEFEAPNKDVEMSQKNLNTLSLESKEEELEVSSSDEIETITSKEKIFQDTDKLKKVSDADNFGTCMKLKPQNNSKLNRNPCSLKRKLEVPESAPVKRPCSRSSVDSSSSEFVPNENKPFNSEKQSFEEEKMLRDGKLKNSDLAQGFKKDLFCKQRTNNNGDILGQKDIFSKNSHMKGLSNPEKKSGETDISKELNSL